MIEGLGYRYGSGGAVLEGVSLEVARGECVALLGPSGSGKTTLLQLVAGLLTPASGRILFDGAVLAAPGRSVPPERRHFGMVFQDFALWPHMTVAANVGFPLQVRGVGRGARATRVGQLLNLLRLSGFEHRYPHELSGGQRQRVALARAMAAEPDLVLFDEPMSNLDARLRTDMRVELVQTLRGFGATALYVTHDCAEAMAMASRIALLEGGRVVQCGTPQELYQHPATIFAARFMGAANVLPARVRDARAGRSPSRGAPVEVEVPGAGCAGGVALLAGTAEQPVAAEVSAVFRPEDAEVCAGGDDPPGDAGLLRGRVVHTAYTGPGWESRVEVAAGVQVTVTGRMSLAGAVRLRVPPDRLLLLPA